MKSIGAAMRALPQLAKQCHRSIVLRLSQILLCAVVVGARYLTLFAYGDEDECEDMFQTPHEVQYTFELAVLPQLALCRDVPQYNSNELYEIFFYLCLNGCGVFGILVTLA